MTYDVELEFIVPLLFVVVCVLTVALVFTTVLCIAYKSRCARLMSENRMLRRTVKGQDYLKAASNAAYQEMLSAAFGNRRMD